MASTFRILVASSAAPLATAIPLLLLGALMWSYAINGPFANSGLGAVSPLQAGLEFALPIYALLAFGLLVISLILRAVDSLTRRNMLQVSAAISIAVGLLFGGGWWGPEDLQSELQDAVIGVVAQSLVVFLVLGATSIVWCCIALGPRTKAGGADGA